MINYELKQNVNRIVYLEVFKETFPIAEWQTE